MTAHDLDILDAAEDISACDPTCPLCLAEAADRDVDERDRRPLCAFHQEIVDTLAREAFRLWIARIRAARPEAA